MGRTYKDSKAFKEKLKRDRERENEYSKPFSKDKSKKHKRSYYEKNDQEDI